MLSSSSLFQIDKQKDQIILTPKDQKPQQTLIFLHGWGEPGDNWINYFASGKATPEVILPPFFFSSSSRQLKLSS